MDQSTLCAGLTVYRPNASLLLALLDSLTASKVFCLLHIDGPIGEAINPELWNGLRRRRDIGVLEPVGRLGVGGGLNRLCQEARRRDMQRILLLDQDSTVGSSLPGELMKSFDALQNAGLRPAAVGAMPIAPEREITQPPRYPTKRRKLGTREASYLITSGSLIDLAAFEEIGPFRTDYFIDAIDIEWSFRARATGYTLWVSDTAQLPHRIGQGILSFGPLRFPMQSEDRMETYIRNQMHGMTLSHVPGLWKLRTMIYVPLQATLFALKGEHRWATLRRFAVAAAAGWAGRLGPPSR